MKTVKEIWDSRNEEPEPCQPWGLACMYEYEPTNEVELKEAISVALRETDLTPREMAVVDLYFFKDFTLLEAAKAFNGSDYEWINAERQRVGQIKNIALNRLRAGYLVATKRIIRTPGPGA